MSHHPSHSYTGRFAPSPSGPLHFGSLIAALASYLDARAHHGRWLVRMEDVDTPRCTAGADVQILQTLEAHGLNWDGEVVYQSARSEAYQQLISDMMDAGDAYYCTCTRKQIRALGGVYPGSCRGQRHSQDDASVRFAYHHPIAQFTDRIQGKQIIHNAHALEDFIVRRKDGLYAYNLAVVADDIWQGVTHIVRGSDLLDTTAAHLGLYRYWQQPAPVYAHIPVASTETGYKLSKQNKAAGLDNTRAAENLLQALKFLQLNPPDNLFAHNCDKILDWAVGQWCTDKLPKQAEIIVDKSESTYYNQS